MCQSRLHEQSLSQVLSDVYAEVISLDDEETKRAREIVTAFVVKTYINEMKKVDPLFKALFQEVFFAGSFYDGLRVSHATEFDLDIVLDLPFYHEDLKVCDRESKLATALPVVHPGYAMICSEKSFNELLHPKHPRYNDYKQLERFFETNSTGYTLLFSKKYYYLLNPAKVLNWFEGVVKKAVDSVVYNSTSWLSRKLSSELYFNSGINGVDINITLSKSGPAHTLKIKCKSGLCIDIDLVPVFNMFHGKYTGMNELSYQEVFLVPKPHQENKSLWRLSFAKQERSIIHNQSCAKKVIKLLKRFRDMQGTPWKKLSSYYIKTLVMLELQEGKIWHDRELGDLFIGTLQKLKECLDSRWIPFYFDKKFNLLHSINSQDTIDNMNGRLKNILKDIDRNPPITLRKYFLEKECNTDTVDGSYTRCMVM